MIKIILVNGLLLLTLFLPAQTIIQKYPEIEAMVKAVIESNNSNQTGNINNSEVRVFSEGLPYYVPNSF